MKIAFASEGEGIKSTLSHHFGRCPYYVFFEVENNKVKYSETKKNPFYEKHEPGAVPKFIAEEKADVIIAGGMGPKAIEWFEKLNVVPITTDPRRIGDILDDYLAGKLSGAESCKDHETL